jgi:uncharacterized protein with HEPN domain
MDIEIKVLLHDVKNAIDEISSFFADGPKLFHSFQHDLRTKRAVERNLEIIGEAISRIIKKDPAISISNTRKIIDTRNRIIHGYDNISDEMIWSIVINHLPKLEKEVNSLLIEKKL